jgi:hypothetical protein
VDRIERLCPACKAANAMERSRCHACGADMMSHLPVPVGQRLPVPWKKVGTSLALSAGALALRGGLRLAKHAWEKRGELAEQRVQTRSLDKVKGWLSRREKGEQAPGPQPQVRMWGRRVWGRRGSDGSSQLEVQEFYWQAHSDER